MIHAYAWDTALNIIVEWKERMCLCSVLRVILISCGFVSFKLVRSAHSFSTQLWISWNDRKQRKSSMRCTAGDSLLHWKLLLLSLHYTLTHSGHSLECQWLNASELSLLCNAFQVLQVIFCQISQTCCFWACKTSLPSQDTALILMILMNESN